MIYGVIENNIKNADIPDTAVREYKTVKILLLVNTWQTHSKKLFYASQQASFLLPIRAPSKKLQKLILKAI